MNYPHSCHKSFRSREEAKDFIKEYQMTAELVKRGSLDGDIGTVLGDMMRGLRLE